VLVQGIGSAIMNYALAKQLDDAGFPYISRIGRLKMAISIFAHPDLPDIPIPRRNMSMSGGSESGGAISPWSAR
jgi:hypothetical protein